MNKAVMGVAAAAVAAAAGAQTVRFDNDPTGAVPQGGVAASLAEATRIGLWQRTHPARAGAC